MQLNNLKKLRKEEKPKYKDEIKQLQDQLVEIAREDCGDPCSLDSGAYGNGEIRVIGEDDVCASPAMIYHYVEKHNYLPPKEFVKAVENQT